MFDKIVIIIYFALMLGAGYVGSRRNRNSDDFTVAGRRLGPFMYTSAMSTVVLGGAATVGGVSLGYQHGISGMALVLMLSLGIAMIGVLFAGTVHRNGVRTVPEALERTFGRTSGLLGSVIVIFYTLFVGVAQIIAIGTVLTVVFDMPRALAAAVGWAVITLYSVAGGMWSITMTDVIQFLIKTVGIFALLLPMAIAEADGLGSLQEKLPATYFDPVGIGVSTIAAYFLLFFFGFLIDQGNWQRLATARSERVARWGALVSGVYCALYGLAGALIGTAAKALLPTLSTADDAYASVASLVLPAGVFGVVIAAALAASMSTASGLLIGSSTVLTGDVLRPKYGERMNSLRANRIALLAVCVAALAIALAMDSVVGAVTVATDLLAAGLFIPITFGLLWRRSTAFAAVASIVAGSVVCIVFMILDGLYANEPVMFGMLASLVAFAVASLVRRKEHSAPERTLKDVPAVPS
ncbi:sodium:solute symporter family transporter [Saccharopolyspora elongata]|uniref:Sodium:solute symporter n=1 Tax=Saccharopolyspora elongata TaxID=2530387 RepID=A0A4R4XX53_9PSEU|nr:sodium:solute symporter [Saccharopolyspora elongata]TDD35599.1 sodium:solute symporter [Saccharopolyspora elongata]